MRHSTVRFKIMLAALGLMLSVIALAVSSPVSADPSFRGPIVAHPASICIWDNSTGNWSDTAHWSCGAVPGAGGADFFARWKVLACSALDGFASCVGSAKRSAVVDGGRGAK